MHVVLVRYCYRKSSVRPSVRPSLRLSVCDVDVSGAVKRIKKGQREGREGIECTPRSCLHFPCEVQEKILWWQQNCVGGAADYLFSGCCEELGQSKYSGTDTDGDDDVSGSSRRAPDDRLHRKTDADVAFHRERDRQPDSGVTADVGQLMPDARLVRDVYTRRSCVNTCLGMHRRTRNSHNQTIQSTGWSTKSKPTS